MDRQNKKCPEFFARLFLVAHHSDGLKLSLGPEHALCMGDGYADERLSRLKQKSISAISWLRLNIRTMMRTLTLLLTFCTLVIGIAANANIQMSKNKEIQAVSTHIKNSNRADSSSSKPRPDPATTGFLLGIGIVCFVCTGRRD
ncbi:MAG: hypothetical protein PVJ84_20815 [Desulfobacteraceae bacterium]